MFAFVKYIRTFAAVMKKEKFYVVWAGVTPGIYTSWTECQLQTKGYEGAKFKSFDTREEAEQAFAASPYEYIKRNTSAGSTPSKPSQNADALYLAAILAVVGHSKPIYFGFKGGKGVLVAAGAILAVQPVLLPVLALIFLVCLVPTGMVSLGSITMAAAYPVLTLVYSLMRGLPTRDVVVCTVGAAIMGGMVIWMHRSNIQRIRDGKEYRFGQKHKSN